jgi:hypothetical protein
MLAVKLAKTATRTNSRRSPILPTPVSPKSIVGKTKSQDVRHVMGQEKLISRKETRQKSYRSRIKRLRKSLRRALLATQAKRNETTSDEENTGATTSDAPIVIHHTRSRRTGT